MDRAVLDRERGWVSEADVQKFVDAGFTRANVLDVILGITFKRLSNYANHVADTPLDEAFGAQAIRRAV